VITETVFHLTNYDLVMVDAGNRRIAQEKVIHCFQDVTNIIFVVSLSGYDQCLYEDDSVVREGLCRIQDES
jgi:guanine nucleotide-binding protein subunit alpha